MLFPAACESECRGHGVRAVTTHVMLHLCTLQSSKEFEIGGFLRWPQCLCLVICNEFLVGHYFALDSCESLLIFL